MTGAALDLRALQELKSLLDAEFANLLATFIRDSNSRLQLIREAIESQNLDVIREQAHSFKGSSANLYAPQLSALCASLEHAARDGKLERATSLLSEIENEYALVLATLDEQGLL